MARDHSSSELQYAQLFIDGDTQGLAWYYTDLYASLLLFAEKLLGGDAFIAEELVQDAFVNAWQRRASFETPFHIRASLYQTVRHRAIDQLRKQTRRQTAYQAYSPSTFTDASVFSAMVQADQQRYLRDALAQLPPGMARVVRMYYLEEKSAAEIAAELDRSLCYVKSARQRGIAKLKLQLKKGLGLLLGWV